MSMDSRRGFLLSGCAVAMTAYAADGSRPQRSAWAMPKKQPFRTVENTWITLKDGIRLGARLWIPLSADHTPVPVVWEYIPYRKRDLERPRARSVGRKSSFPMDLRSRRGGYPRYRRFRGTPGR